MEKLRQVLESTTLMGEPCADGQTVADKLVESWVNHAIKGNPALLREILERTEGKIAPTRPAPEIDLDQVVPEVEALDAGYSDPPEGPVEEVPG